MNIIDHGQHDPLPFELGSWRDVANATKKHIEAATGRQLTNVEQMTMADEADFASNVEQMQRDSALNLHARRSRDVPMCESCEEQHVHVTSNGLRWRFCADCAQEHLQQRNKAA